MLQLRNKKLIRNNFLSLFSGLNALCKREPNFLLKSNKKVMNTCKASGQKSGAIKRVTKKKNDPHIIIGSRSFTRLILS